MKTISVGIIILTLVVISLSTIGTTHAYFTSKQVTGSHLISTWQSTFWTQTTQADFLAGVPVNVDTISNPGGVKLAGRNTSPTMYGISGGATTAFHQYNVSNNTWNPLRNTPGSVSTGGAVADNNLNYLYVLRGGGTRNFYQYSISSNSWSSLTQTPAAINAGGALASTGGNYLYALRGAGTRNFYRYSISSNSWSSLTQTLAAINAGGALASTGGNYLYALRGAGTRNFYRYSISSNSWSSLTQTPAAINAGGALVSTGGDYLYALRGAGMRNFYRYSISSNSWSSLAQTPAAINAGGALASDQGNCIYAFNGSSEKFWVYNIDTNTWNDSVVSDVPSPVGWGGSLAFMPVSTYYQSYGTFASEVNNSGQAGTHGDIFEWDEIVASGITDITFEVRASDTSFTKADPLPSWISVGGTSPIRSGLPSGQFRQWRATLSTGNSTITPILNEVRLWSS